MTHFPVMLNQVIRHFFDIREGLIIDATLGAGGHAEGLLRSLPEPVRVLGIDRDGKFIQAVRERLKVFSNRFSALNTNFSDYDGIRKAVDGIPVYGILMDLGISSMQYETGRGFSLRDETSLDMRMDTGGELTAAEIVNTWPEDELARCFRNYGEERYSRRIARAIVRQRADEPFSNGKSLAEFIARHVPPDRRIHPATRVFQALRIAVNDELTHLSAGLETAKKLLACGGRLAVITFHSLEDRIVKRFFNRNIGKCECPPDFPVCVCHPVKTFKILTAKPLRPDEAEVRRNPPSRSAKFRCVEKVAE